MSLEDILTPTGETHEGLPVFRLGSPERDAARARRDAALDAALAVASRGEPIPPELEREIWDSKVEYFRAMGWGEPKLGRPAEGGGR